jgi:hypothetical protein
VTAVSTAPRLHGVAKLQVRRAAYSVRACIALDPEDGGSNFLRRAGELVPDYTPSNSMGSQCPGVRLQNGLQPNGHLRGGGGLRQEHCPLHTLTEAYGWHMAK